MESKYLIAFILCLIIFVLAGPTAQALQAANVDINV